MGVRLFIYGTLKRGHRAHPMLSEQRFLGEATTVPRYRLLNLGWYPGLAICEDQGLSIEGEIWEVSESCLVDLDRYESDEYEKVPIDLLPPHKGTTVLAYVLREPDWTRPDAGTCWMGA